MGQAGMLDPSPVFVELCDKLRLEALHVPTTFDLVQRVLFNRRLGRLLVRWTESSSGTPDCDGGSSAFRYTSSHLGHINATRTN
jgi:hypothetical protein